MISGYSSPFNVGHNALADFWQGTVHMEEKVDGSQFSFRKENDTILARAHKQDLTIFTHQPELAGMFRLALETVNEIAPLLHEGWTYRGEFLQTCHHNTLVYERAPDKHIILFDVDTGDQAYLEPLAAQAEATRIGLEFVPIFGVLTEKPTLEELTSLLNRISCLGKEHIEGIVLKNYSLYGMDKKVLMAKLVRRDFIEDNRDAWKKAKPQATATLDDIITTFATEQRWTKAVQHLREEGKIIGAPQDIALLIHEVPADIFKDHEQEIKDRLFNHYKKDLMRGFIRGLPEWYKRELAKTLVGE